MKNIILFIFFTAGTLSMYAQKLSKENVPGTWQTRSITAPSGMYYNEENDSLSLPKSVLASLKKEGMKDSAIKGIKEQLSIIKSMLFVFNNDGSYTILNTVNPAKTDSMEIGKYEINGAKGLIFNANKKGSKPQKIKAYFKSGRLILHAPGEANAITIFELEKKK